MAYIDNALVLLSLGLFLLVRPHIKGTFHHQKKPKFDNQELFKMPFTRENPDFIFLEP